MVSHPTHRGMRCSGSASPKLQAGPAGERQIMKSGFAALLSVLLLTASAFAASASASHPRDFWLQLRAKEFALPQGQPALPLALEAAQLLGSTDPQLRDGVAYEALETWIYGRPALTPAELGTVREALVTNARKGLGQATGDELYLRSFSILVLSVVAAGDLKQPLIDAQHFDELVDLSLAELAHERDLRGYTADKGWGHATAHCADLLKFLSRSPRLRPEQQLRIVAGIEGRLRSAGIVFVWGEDARLAAALASLARRSDANVQAFEQWFTRLVEEHKAVWSGEFNEAGYVAVRAQLNTLSQLGAELEADNASGAIQQIRAALRKLRAQTR